MHTLQNKLCITKLASTLLFAMIVLKTAEELKKMRYAGLMTAKLLRYLGSKLEVNLSTLELNIMAEKWIAAHSLRSATLHYNGFPASICTSINDVVCHGIPKASDILQEGDIINIDVSLIANGYHGDTSKTFSIGRVHPEVANLVSRTKEALYRGIAAIQPGHRINVIGNAIQQYTQPFGYSIVRSLCGHGIGRKFHEEPMVLHAKERRKGVRMKVGMTFTIEPMINIGVSDVYIDPSDNWTVFTQDHKLSAQFEHTIAITETGVEILTLLEDS